MARLRFEAGLAATPFRGGPCRDSVSRRALPRLRFEAGLAATPFRVVGRRRLNMKRDESKARSRHLNGSWRGRFLRALRLADGGRLVPARVDPVRFRTTLISPSLGAESSTI